MKKRIFAAIVCAAIFCGLFAGCAKSPEDQLKDELMKAAQQLQNELK